MKTFHLSYRLWLPQPREILFPFFSDAFKLEEITPVWLRIRVLAVNPNPMELGTEIDYRLRIRGIPVRWQTGITEWNPPQHFVDEQVRGIFRLWVHEHRFSEQGGGTLCEDLVRYATPGGALMNWLFVERDLREMFAFRAARFQAIFGQGRAESGSAVAHT